MAEIETAPPGEAPVSYERSDLQMGSVVKFGAILVFGVALSMAALVGLYWLMESWEEQIKKDQLPEAYGDRTLPPEPRLEGIDDIRAGNFRPWPPRAAEFHAQEERALKGEDGKSGTRIDEAIRVLGQKGRLPARTGKGTNAEPPTNHQIRLPSRASSGWTTTGGQ